MRVTLVNFRLIQHFAQLDSLAWLGYAVFSVSERYFVVAVFPLVSMPWKVDYPVDFLEMKFLSSALQPATHIVNASNDDLSIPLQFGCTLNPVLSIIYRTDFKPNSE